MRGRNIFKPCSHDLVELRCERAIVPHKVERESDRGTTLNATNDYRETMNSVLVRISSMNRLSGRIPGQSKTGTGGGAQHDWRMLQYPSPELFNRRML